MRGPIEVESRSFEGNSCRSFLSADVSNPAHGCLLMSRIELSDPDWLRPRHIVLLQFAIWLLTAAISLSMHRDEIAVFNFSDSDDAMRLVQVRDFLAGQSWFDVSQHRVNPPFGGPMHWSRLVDLPIAASVLLFRPLLGPHGAEMGALLIVPGLTLALLLSALYWALRPHLKRAGALLSCALFASSAPVLMQFAAMRIDHHAWQIVLMAMVMGGTLHSSSRRGGLVAGCAMAVWLNVSAEGLPFAVLTGGVLAVRYAFDATEWPRCITYLWTLIVVSTALLLLTHGWSHGLEPYCDSVSPAYLLPMAVVPVAITAGRLLVGTANPERRLLTMAVGAGAAVGVFALTAEHCFSGPFGALDAQVRRFWYEVVSEGLPIWEQDNGVALMILLPALVGVTGYCFAVRQEVDVGRKRDWVTLLALTVGAIVVSMLVARAMSIAHVLAVPGNAWLMLVLCKRARRLDAALLRVPATAASLTLFAPLITVAASTALLPKNPAVNSVDAKSYIANEVNELAALNSIAPATLFAPIDLGAHVLLLTRHSIIASGHHRNTRGMKLVITGFVASPEEAHAIVSSTSAAFVLMVRSRETDNYRKASPGSLAARLWADEPPDWLTPVSVPGLKTLRLYRVSRMAGVRAPDVESLK